MLIGGNWLRSRHNGVRMRIDDPSDGDAADDRVPEHDHIRSAESAEGAEARDREECYRDLRAYDQLSGRPSASGRPDEPRIDGDGGWKWKGLELGPEANRVADSGLAACQAAEGRDAAGNYGEGEPLRACPAPPCRRWPGGRVSCSRPVLELHRRDLPAVARRELRP